jgi:hypothetical protein
MANNSAQAIADMDYSAEGAADDRLSAAGPSPQFRGMVM